MMSKVLVTGGAGFVGSHLVDSLVAEHKVLVVDNLSQGKREFVNPQAELIEADLLEGGLEGYLEGVGIVFHLAANADVRVGAEDTRADLEQNLIATYNLLEAIRKVGVRKLVFTSTSTVYGEAPIPTPEEYGPLIPISLYGASKLACEALISSYCFTFELQSWIYRFANVIGERATHGVIYDFINKLRRNPQELEILGDGQQAKSYIYVSDCVEAMLWGMKATEKVNIFNIGSDDQISTNRIAQLVSHEMGLNPRIRYTGGKRGWKGDVPIMFLANDKLKRLGWKPKYTSEEAVQKTIRHLLRMPVEGIIS